MSLISKVSKLSRYMEYRRMHKRYKSAQQKFLAHQRNMQKYEKYDREFQSVGNKLGFYKKRLAHELLKILYIFPIKNNRILLMSFQAGKFSCNPKYIAEYLKTNYPGEFEITWAFRDPVEYAWLADWDYQVIKLYSLRYFIYALTSRVVIYNMRFPIVVPFRKGQLTIGTGHGGGAYKKLLLDNPSISRLEKKEIALSTSITNLFISSCAAYTSHVLRGAFGYKGEVLECGMPRNDILVNRDFSQAETVRRYYHIPKDRKIILYAPTYRKGTRTGTDYEIDFKQVVKAAKERFGGEWIVMFRMHYFIKERGTLGSGFKRIDATNYPDMQELLVAADILITDYSSSVWDYSLLNKPGFLYATDLDEYLVKQGFYVDVREWPFPIAQNNAELVDRILNFDMDNCAARIARHHQELGSFENGHATETVARRIHEECFGRK